jgi:uncharacterized protein YaiE (UPF0345 family)
VFIADGRASLGLLDAGRFTLNDATANTEDCTNVVAGSYTVTEGAEPANFTFESLTCTDNGVAGSVDTKTLRISSRLTSR